MTLASGLTDGEAGLQWLTVLGSTGSIGGSTLDVVRRHPQRRARRHHPDPEPRRRPEEGAGTIHVAAHLRRSVHERL